jgi:hypothetical protein
MSALQILRNKLSFVRGMLVWFALSLGVAMASPLVNPQALTLVCSAAGVVQLKIGADGDAPATPMHTMHCVLCMSMGAPPVTVADVAAPASLGFVLRPAPAQRPQGRVATAAAARGPPALA